VSLDAKTQAELGARLDEALSSQSIVIEKSIFNGPHLSHWEPVDGATVIGRLLAATGGGWRVRDSSEAAMRANHLTLTEDA
jgi:hypothetical protein